LLQGSGFKPGQSVVTTATKQQLLLVGCCSHRIGIKYCIACPHACLVVFCAYYLGTHDHCLWVCQLGAVVCSTHALLALQNAIKCAYHPSLTLCWPGFSYGDLEYACASFTAVSKSKNFLVARQARLAMALHAELPMLQSPGMSFGLCWAFATVCKVKLLSPAWSLWDARLHQQLLRHPHCFGRTEIFVELACTQTPPRSVACRSASPVNITKRPALASTTTSATRLTDTYSIA
jgi:hypothetical protein